MSKVADADRWFDLGDGWLVLDRLDYTGGKLPRWEGAIQRTLIHEHPNRSGPKVGTNPLNLPDDEGLGSHVAFLYDVNAKLLWLQRDRSIVGRIYLGDYLRSMTNTTFSMVARLRTDSLKRARKMKTIRIIDFAYLTEGHQRPKGKLGRMLDKLSGYGAARIEIRLSPKRGDTLDPSAVDAVTDLLDAYEEDSERIGKAQIIGRQNPNLDDEFIDLIRDRMQFGETIAAHRSRDADRLINAVRSVWSANRGRV